MSPDPSHPPRRQHVVASSESDATSNATNSSSTSRDTLLRRGISNESALPRVKATSSDDAKVKSHHTSSRRDPSTQTTVPPTNPPQAARRNTGRRRAAAPQNQRSGPGSAQVSRQSNEQITPIQYAQSQRLQQQQQQQQQQHNTPYTATAYSQMPFSSPVAFPPMQPPFSASLVTGAPTLSTNSAFTSRLEPGQTTQGSYNLGESLASSTTQRTSVMAQNVGQTQQQHTPEAVMQGYYIYAPYQPFGGYYPAQPGSPATMQQPHPFLPPGPYHYGQMPPVTYCDPAIMSAYTPSNLPWPQNTAVVAQGSTSWASRPSADVIGQPDADEITMPNSPQEELAGSITSASSPSAVATSLSPTSRPLATSDEATRSSMSRAPTARQARGGTARSSHVMWVGNIPSDATPEELRVFFSKSSATPATAANASSSPGADEILSIFVIGRSNCAFVNYVDEECLQRAVEYFNNRVLRPQDPKAIKLVCRVRKKEEEAQAGVAGQRGKGFHVAFLRDYKRRQQDNSKQGQVPHGLQPTALSGIGDASGIHMTGSDAHRHEALSRSSNMLSGDDIQLSGGDNVNEELSAGASSTSQRPSAGSATSSSADVSYTSTNSDLLRHPAFRDRYFILKSRAIEELRGSVASGQWSTQLHNEAVLDQAFRHSERVFLIFSANSSGAFFGYAIMASGISTQTSSSRQENTREECTTPQQAEGGGIIDHSLASSQSVEKRSASPHSTGSNSGREAHADIAGPPLPGSSTGHIDGKPATSDTKAPGSTDAGQVTGAGASSDPENGVKHRDMATDPDSASPANRSETTDKPEGKMMTEGQRSQSPDGYSERGEVAVPGDFEEVTLDPGDSVSGDARAASQLATRAIIHNLRLEQRESQRKAELLERQLLVEEQLASSGTARIRPSGSPAVSETNTPSIVTAVPHVDDNRALGRPFQVRWIETRQLPFAAIKQLRNPWNENKSLRVARDGTEVAIYTGAELLSKWQAYLRRAEDDSSS